jgi:hypothetical protein
MAWSVDARIPLVTVADEAALAEALAAGPPTAVLSDALLPARPAGAVALERFDPAGAPHALACTCCGGRGAASQALDRLFQSRVRATSPWFARVVALAASAEGRAELAAALREDPLTAARFRPA